MLASLLLELKIVARRPTTWIAWILLVVPPVALARADLDAVIRLPADPATFFISLMPLPLTLAGLLVGAPLLAPARRRRFDPIWVRDPAGLRLANEAIVAGLIAASAGLVLSLVLYIVLAGVSTPQSVDIAKTALIICGPTLVFVVAFTSLAGMVLGELFAAAIVVMLIGLTAFALPQSALFAWTLLGGGTYHDRSIGFGPDWAIVVARSTLYVGVAAALVLPAGWLLARVDRRGARSLGAAALVAAGLALGLLVTANFNAQAHALANIPSWPIVAEGAVIRTRELDVQLDCAHRRLVATSTIEIVSVPSTLWLGLNPGLRVTSVEPAAVGWRQDDSGAIAFDGAQAGGVITVHYAGSLALHRDDYQPTRAGIVPARVVALPIGAYLSSDVCFLTRGGDWYPRAIGRAVGSDGVRIQRLRYQVDQGLTLVGPGIDGQRGDLSDPPPCAVVAVGPNAHVDGPVRPGPDEQLQWDRLHRHLERLGLPAVEKAVWLPLLGGTSAGARGVCIPSRGLPTTLGPFANRLVENVAAQMALRSQLVLETRPAVRTERTSTQENSPRAFPDALPAYLDVLADALADTLEPDVADLIALRQEAVTSDSEGRLLMRGVLPGKPTYLAVLGIHRYRLLSGDGGLRELISALAAEAGDAVPSLDALARVVRRLPANEQAALAPLLAIR